MVVLCSLYIKSLKNTGIYKVFYIGEYKYMKNGHITERLNKDIVKFHKIKNSLRLNVFNQFYILENDNRLLYQAIHTRYSIVEHMIRNI